MAELISAWPTQAELLELADPLVYSVISSLPEKGDSLEWCQSLLGFLSGYGRAGAGLEDLVVQAGWVRSVGKHMQYEQDRWTLLGLAPTMWRAYLGWGNVRDIAPASTFFVLGGDS